MQAKADCGCVLKVDEFRMCRFHYSAQELVEAAQAAKLWLSDSDDDGDLEIMAKLKSALRRAKKDNEKKEAKP